MGKMALPTTLPARLELGARAPDFDLRGTGSKRYSFSTFQDKRLLIVIFSSNGCPTVKACEDRMIAIQREYGPRSVQLLTVNSNNSYLSPADTYEEMMKRALEKGFNFPYVKDEDRKVARAYGAICTPHSFVVDEERRLRYRGRIDDSRNPSTVTVSDLRNALDDLLSNKPVRVSETKPFGCGIVW